MWETSVAKKTMRPVEGFSSRVIRNRHLLLRATSSSSSAEIPTSGVSNLPLSKASSNFIPQFRYTTTANEFYGGFTQRLFLGGFAYSFATSTAASPARKEIPPLENVPKDLLLYQYAACPFCNKVKAVLDYYDLPYKVVEVNPITKKEIKWSDYKKVPILVFDGEQLTNSSEIISIIDNQINPAKEDSSVTAKTEEDKWCRWVDEHLVHMLAPNIYRSPSEALESFDYITSIGNFTTLEKWTGKYAGAASMYLISKKLKKRHNISDERSALYDAAEAWVKGLNNRSFMGGSRPNLADLAVFGVLRPIRHLLSGRDMIANTSIGPWYNRMETAVGESSEVKN